MYTLFYLPRNVYNTFLMEVFFSILNYFVNNVGVFYSLKILTFYGLIVYCFLIYIKIESTVRTRVTLSTYPNDNVLLWVFNYTIK